MLVWFAKVVRLDAQWRVMYWHKCVAISRRRASAACLAPPPRYLLLGQWIASRRAKRAAELVTHDCCKNPPYPPPPKLCGMTPIDLRCLVSSSLFRGGGG